MLRLAWRALTWSPVVLAIAQSGYHISWIQGRSMQPTLNPDQSLGKQDLVLLQKFGLHEPGALKIGDVVLFYSPLDPNKIMVKRIVATGGQEIMPRETSNYPKKKVVNPPNHLWVEGDSIHSVDSNTFGPISSGLVLGKVKHILLPINRFGPVPLGGRQPLQ